MRTSHEKGSVISFLMIADHDERVDFRGYNTSTAMIPERLLVKNHKLRISKHPVE